MNKAQRCAEMTANIRNLLEQTAAIGVERRRLWHEANKDDGLTQDVLARTAGVTKHTVYTEIRRHRENA